MNFLEQAAGHIFEKHQADFTKTCVILPSRRAVFYFKRHLAELSETPFLSPDVMAIDDFVVELSGLRIIDPVSLLFEVYDVFKAIDPEVKFDKFMTWASTLLTDFDAIDQSLTNPTPLFNYMSAARALTRWNTELASSQKPNFQQSKATDKYFKLFENLSLVYEELRARLTQKQLAYRGLAYRFLAENIDTKLLENTRFEKFYFVGLNALSRSENRIITQLVKAKRAETLWDSDGYYMNTSDMNAGRIMRGYRKDGRFGEWNWLSDNLLTQPKKIRIFPCQNASFQAKLTGHLYEQMLVEDPNNETVIVLNDETMLNPLMHALSDNVTDFNITMGLTLKQSMLYTFIMSIFDLQANLAEFRKKETGEKFFIPKFSHRHISKLLKHPLVKRYELIHFEGQETEVYNPISAILKEIIVQSKAFFTQEELLAFGPEDPLIRYLFSRWNNEAQKAIDSFFGLIKTIREIYRETPDAIETEYLFLFFTSLNRLKDTLKGRSEVGVNSLKVFISELFRQTRIPFSGDPVAKLQMMSMLETRTLDFKRVILLSMNEGTLPASKKQNSLIPFDAAIEFGLPIHTEQDAIMAYHFYRLLQRAEQIDILYLTQGGEGIGTKEPSRFLMQIENDLAVKNPKIEITYPVVTFKQKKTLQYKPIAIEKTEELLQSIRQLVAEKGLYASHLNDYVACTIRYYFKQIAQIRAERELSEVISTQSFGDWLHNVLEKIDLDYTVNGRKIERQDVPQIITELPERLEVEQLLLFKTLSFDYGMNLLYKKTALKLLVDFWKQQQRIGQFPMEVLGFEKQIITGFMTEINGQKQYIKVSGRVDRLEIDRALKTITVVDYKTGKVNEKDLELKPGRNEVHSTELIQKIFLEKEEKEKVRQLWIYQYLLLKKMHTEGGAAGLKIGQEVFKTQDFEVNTKIYSFRNLKGKLETKIAFKENGEDTTEFLHHSEEILRDFMADMLDASKPFMRTEDTKKCEYCDFTGLCGR